MQPEPSPINVSVIVAEIRDDVTRRRAAGEYPEELLARLQTEFRTALEGQTLDEMAHIETVRPLESLRPGLGHAVVAVKRLIRRSIAWYVRPITEDQSRFNFAVLRELERLRRRVEALEPPWQRPAGAPAAEIGAATTVGDLTAARVTMLDTVLRGSPPGAVALLHCTDPALLREMQRHGWSVEVASRDPEVRSAAHAAGIRVHDLDPEAFLSESPHELAAIVACGLLPLLTPAGILRIVPLAAAALRPGGRLVLDAPDPRSPTTPHEASSIDPAMLRYVGADVAVMLCEAAGLEDVRTMPLGPRDAEGSAPWYGVAATRSR